MTLSAPQSTRPRSSGFFQPLPVDLQTVVFCHLTSFQDVLGLASTCRQLRDVWLKGLTTIYKHVAKRNITCERHARYLLADQGGPPPEAGIQSARNVYQMMRNQNMVYKAIAQFASAIVSKVRTHGLRAAEYYGPGVDSHPPYLTRTERPRFIRSYYRLWGLLSIENIERRQARLQSLSLKQLLYLCEISWLPHGMGPGEYLNPETEAMVLQQRIQAREKLSQWILQHTESTYQRIHGQDMELIWVIAMDEGYGDFLVMWDHWHNSLKEVVCGRRAKEPPFKKGMHLELWEESLNEDE
ncbi:MAG: hypothetical protein LQ337_002480 [Flavoplaca oasis]|nr:MAG: hypothetical protein LQ337_002480 [Flavoplaca oasis]